MSTIILIAIRNLWRNKMRTALTFFVVFAGTFLIMFVFAMNQGFQRNLLLGTLNFNSGYVVLQNSVYLATPSISHYITDITKREKKLKEVPYVKGVKNLIMGEGTIQSGFNTLPVMVQGIVPTYEKFIKSALYTKIISGNYLQDKDTNGIILGKKLAKKLKVKVGNKVVILVSDSKNNLNQMLLYVHGIFETGADSVDNSLIQMTLKTSRKLYNMPPDSLTRIGVIIDRAQNLPFVLTALKKQNTDIAVLPWEKTNSTIATLIQFRQIIIYTILIFFEIIILGLVYNTISMSVVERKKEYQLAISLGTPLPFIRWTIFYETLCLNINAVLFATIMSIIVNAWIKSVHGIALMSGAKNMSIGSVTLDFHILFFMNVWQYCAIIIPMIGVTLLLSLIPIMRSTRINLTDRN